ncbi:MAG: aspartate kinase, partial [Micromonosporaceae bacterium]|nr:aspartate kinase [Micromonosporaceae bacterium]
RGRTTDELMRLAATFSTRPALRELDQLLSTGEIASAALLALALHELGVQAVSLTGGQAGIQATGPHGSGVISKVSADVITEHLAAGRVPIVAGFQAVTGDGDVITLGRGGSDTTAVALASELGARCEIFTDVDGVFSGDPRVVETAQLLSLIPAEVMTELAFGGARVMHSRAVELAALTGLDIEVRNSATPSPGTTIAAGADGLESRGSVLAVGHDRDVARVLVQAPVDLARQVLDVLARHAVPADLVARSGSGEAEFRMGFTVSARHVEQMREALESAVRAAGGVVAIDVPVGKVSLVGIGMLNRPELVTRLLTVLDLAGITTSWVSLTQLRTSVVVPLDRVDEAVVLVHREFQLGDSAPAGLRRKE